MRVRLGRPILLPQWSTGKTFGQVGLRTWALSGPSGKGTHTATCILQGHPLGAEGRVVLDGDVKATQAFRDTKSMIDTTTAWREAFEAKGWVELP